MLMSNMAAYLLVFVRMAGMIAMNPLFSRRNVPNMVRVGLALCLTVLIAPAFVGYPGLLGLTGLDLTVAMFRELFIGIVCGFVFQIFYYMLFMTGDLMDVQFGLSMAKVFDPGTHIQMSVSSNLLNILFVLYIFATDSHLLLIKLFATSFEVIKPGGAVVSVGVLGFIIDLFIMVFSLALRLALPFIAAEFILEMAMGILMKLIPQIHVFVINIQFKMLLGIFLLLGFAGPISSFLDNYMRLMFEQIQKALFALA